jgi:adenylate kinase
MKVIVTGQVGLDKASFIDRVIEIARADGREVASCNVGQMMYAEAPDVAPGRILDLPLGRLTSLRRSVFKDILRTGSAAPNVIVNTHATFRWKHGLFYAFDYDQMKALDADIYVSVVDNIDRVHYRLRRDGHADHTLKDLMVWREEETLATELVAQIVRGHGRFYICSRGRDGQAAATLARLILYPEHKRVYLSYPMSHLTQQADPRAVAEVEGMRRQMKRHFVCFDPGDVDEKYLCQPALKAAEQGRRTFEAGPPEERTVLETAQVLEIIPDIDGQIYARDFKLIDQSEMIVSFVPELAGGRPGLSSGVERELQHAHEATKEVFVIWRSAAEPSPFVTATATKVFPSTGEAIAYFGSNGYLPQAPGGSLFA